MCESLRPITLKGARKLKRALRLVRWDGSNTRTIDQSESPETDLSMNTHAATRKMVNYARVG